MIGDVANEGTLFSPNASSTEEVAIFFTAIAPGLTQNDTDAIIDRYPPTTPVPKHAEYFGTVSTALSESVFICPGLLMCDAHSYMTSSTIWNYSFNVSSIENEENGLGVTHASDTAAILGPYYNGVPRSASVISFTTYNAPVVPVLMDYYISFVRDLSPNTYRHSTSPVWEPFVQEGTRQRLRIEVNATTMEDVPQPLLTNCQFWYSLANTTQQ